MLKTIKKTAWILKFGFYMRSKMCLGCMHFRAPHAALKQKNYRNSSNSFQNNLTCFVFVIDILFPFFLFFFVNFQRNSSAFHLCVEYDDTKWIPLNKKWYAIYIRQIFCNDTCIYVPLNSEIVDQNLTHLKRGLV